MADRYNVERWSDVRGLCTSINPDELPPGLVPSITDVELVQGAIGRRRPSLQALSLTSGPSAYVAYLYTFTTAAGVDELWAFIETGATTSAYRYVSGSWNSVTLATAASQYYHCATLNGKLFTAYSNTGNRLHLWDGTAHRKVGLSQAAAPSSVANGGGAGAYAATARYYRIQYLIKSGSTIIAQSELSTAVSFTPSGANANATVTKGATSDSATHWRLYGLIASAGDTYDLYEQVGSDTVVGTTTIADTTDPASYSGTNPPELGINIPPPPAKWLATDGSRLLMAGSYHTTAGHAYDKQSRVWFTRRLGASDQGDDESVPNSETFKYYVDCGEKDGDDITALAGPIDGVFYVFKQRGIYRLIPTGNEITPYIVEKVSSQHGAVKESGCTQYTTLVAEDSNGQPAIYFVEYNLIYRLSPGGGIELVNADLWPFLSGTNDERALYLSASYWTDRRQLIFVTTNITNFLYGARVYQPRLAFRDNTGALRGGWSEYTLKIDADNATPRVNTVVQYRPGSTSYRSPFFGGGGTTGTNAKIGSMAPFGNLGTDMGVTAYTPTITSRPYRFGQGGRLNFSCGNPIIEALAATGATPTIAYIRDYGVETRSVTAPSLAATGSETRVAVKVEALKLADARVVQVQYTWDSDQFTTAGADLTGAILIPYKVQEPR